MTVYKVCVVGGWCGNRMVTVAEHLDEVLAEAGFPCKVFHHSVWNSFAEPPASHVVLQLLPAFTEAEANCPVINIKPLLLDLDHPQTIRKILDHIQNTYPAVTGRGSVPALSRPA